MFLRYLIHPCFGDCSQFVLLKNTIGLIPIAGPLFVKFICFQVCLWIGGLKILYNMASYTLGI